MMMMMMIRFQVPCSSRDSVGVGRYLGSKTVSGHSEIGGMAKAGSLCHL